MVFHARPDALSSGSEGASSILIVTSLARGDDTRIAAHGGRDRLLTPDQRLRLTVLRSSEAEFDRIVDEAADAAAQWLRRFHRG